MKEVAMKWIRLSVLALAVAAPSLPAGAQEPGGDVFGEAIDVRVVNVEAVVTDKRGHRVRGLTAADFRLLVDGQEVPIDYFTEVVGGEMASYPSEPGEPAPAPAVAPGGKVGTSYLVFIDDSFSIGAHRDLVLDRLARDLGRLRPEDRMAVVAFDGRRIDRLSDWTGDRAALARVLAEARRRPAWGLHRLALRRSETEQIFGLFSEIELATAAAAASMRGMASPPGRKVFLLLSGGWPMGSGAEILEDPFRQVSNRGSEPPGSSREERFGEVLGDPLRTIPSSYYVPRPEEIFEPITDMANLLGYTIYPVDVAGIDPQSNPADASRPSPVPVVASTRLQPGSELPTFVLQDFNAHPPLPLISSGWERGVHDTLNFLAAETGGKASLNSTRLNALERVQEDTSSYYWLGFTPQRRADGKRHDIRVEVRRPGLEVRSRDGFLDMSRGTETARKTESLLLFGGEGETKRLRFQVGEPRRAGLWHAEVPVTVEVPAESLTSLPVGGGYEVRALLSSAVQDRWSGRSEVQMVPLRLRLDEAPAPGSFLRYQTTLKLRRVQQHLVFAVSDTVGEGQVWGTVDLKL
jgi:VWFA-related protein